jgi:L-aminopeptidase/D-esterase-like protein
MIFSAATGTAKKLSSPGDRIEIGMTAADCLARAIARAVYEAEPLHFPGALPSWRGKFDGS